MGIIGNLIGTDGVGTQEPSFQVLDAVYGKNAILLDDIGQLIGVRTGIPLPLLGFQYELPSDLVLLKYSYSKYPYLNRSVVSNASIKETTTFRLRAYKPISNVDTFILNYGLNELLLKVLDNYLASGGLFTILTPWGVMKNCALQQLNGIKDGSEMGGQGFEFLFEKLNIPSDIAKAQSNFLSAITAGTAL